jgi:hypothetical protein
LQDNGILYLLNLMRNFAQWVPHGKEKCGKERKNAVKGGKDNARQKSGG